MFSWKRAVGPQLCDSVDYQAVSHLRGFCEPHECGSAGVLSSLGRGRCELTRQPFPVLVFRLQVKLGLKTKEPPAISPYLSENGVSLELKEGNAPRSSTSRECRGEKKGSEKKWCGSNTSHDLDSLSAFYALCHQTLLVTMT